MDGWGAVAFISLLQGAEIFLDKKGTFSPKRLRNTDFEQMVIKTYKKLEAKIFGQFLLNIFTMNEGENVVG